MEVFYVNTPQLYTYTFSLSIPLSQNALRRLRFDALSEAVQIPATGERRSERDRERYRTAVPHGIATESEGRYRLARLRGDRRPSKGGVTSRLKLLCAVLDPHLTDAPRGLSSTHI